ncbi:neuronal acetylcholine receptor subunit alpha-6-like [Ruditapes philippinarum]|uniref:neuronal acetylcholine receptor subunit alpha-6-like n=1 Tax=Ruditapes philippinarum TaxID=129788 RepID=UPI00295AE24E|nr:neuronal acetylcholine receptor subunit alpha-6-like [Ruditapes philippinarum]
MKFLFCLILIVKVYLSSCQYSGNVENLRNALSIPSSKSNIRPESSLNVSVGLNVVSLHLDSHKETMAVTGKLTMIWNDPRYAWNAGTYSNINTLLLQDGDIWKPELVLENMMDDIKVIYNEKVYSRLYSTSLVVLEVPVNVLVHCPLDFTYYPFDKQTCRITLSSWSYDYSEMSLFSLTDKVNMDMHQEKSEFEFVQSNVETTQKSDSQSGQLRTYSTITFYLTVRRHTEFYGLVLALPLVVISVLTILTFMLPIESGEKAHYSITLLLMVAVYYAAALEYIPVFTGVSVLVGYISVVLLLAMLATFCEFLVLYFYHQDRQREMKPSMVSLLHILAKITCKLGSTEDTNSMVTSEGTSSTRVSHHDLQGCSSLPNGGLDPKKPGRLSPIHRRVEPVRDSLPPLEPTPRTDTSHVMEQATVTGLLPERKPIIKEILPNRCPWQHLAKCLDTLFLVIFLIISFITHFIFLVVLGTGSL